MQIRSYKIKSPPQILKKIKALKKPIIALQMNDMLPPDLHKNSKHF